MFPILDFSNAAVWVGGGFLAGGAAHALLQALSGINRRNARDLVQASMDLERANDKIKALQRESEGHASKAQYLENELKKQAPAAVEPHESADITSLKYQLIAATKEAEFLRVLLNEAKAKNEQSVQEVIAALQLQLDAAAATDRANKDELSSHKAQVFTLAAQLRETVREMESWRRKAQERVESSGQESNSLSSPAAASSSQSHWLESELKRLQVELSNAALELQSGSDERAKQSAEISKLNSTLSNAYADLRRTLAELHAVKHDLKQRQDDRHISAIVVNGTRSQGFLDSRVCNLGS